MGARTSLQFWILDFLFLKSHGEILTVCQRSLLIVQRLSAVSDAIYSRVPGSSFQNVSRGIGGAWVIPCTTELNISFIIGGVKFPIHPLDTSMDWNENGQTICLGSVGAL
jgi:hypothetical protein